MKKKLEKDPLQWPKKTRIRARLMWHSNSSCVHISALTLCTYSRSKFSNRASATSWTIYLDKSLSYPRKLRSISGCRRQVHAQNKALKLKQSTSRYRTGPILHNSYSRQSLARYLPSELSTWSVRYNSRKVANCFTNSRLGVSKTNKEFLCLRMENWLKLKFNGKRRWMILNSRFRVRARPSLKISFRKWFSL